MTKRKSDVAKVRGAFARAFAQLRRSLPVMLLPWRLIPQPIVLALIALIALAMVLDTVDQNVGANPPASIGGTDVPSHLDCAEDEVIGFVGIPDTLVCVHVDTFCPEGEHVSGVSDVCKPDGAQSAESPAQCGSDAHCASKFGGDGSPVPAPTPTPER